MGPPLDLSEPDRAPTGPAVRRPVMHQRWEDLLFVHWPVEPDAVARRLPPGLAPDTFDGSAWVSLVPFRMVGIRPAGLPTVPWLLTFAEVNIRTYVLDTDGRPAVWFESLDVPRLAAVPAARLSLGLPYCWADATVAVDGDRYTSSVRRRWPAGRASTHVEAEVGGPLGAATTIWPTS